MISCCIVLPGATSKASPLFCLFRCVRIVAKTAYYLCHVLPSIRPPQCISEARINRSSVKFDIGAFYASLSRLSKFR